MDWRFGRYVVWPGDCPTPLPRPSCCVDSRLQEDALAQVQSGGLQHRPRQQPFQRQPVGPAWSFTQVLPLEHGREDQQGRRRRRYSSSDILVEAVVADAEVHEEVYLKAVRPTPPRHVAGRWERYFMVATMTRDPIKRAWATRTPCRSVPRGHEVAPGEECQGKPQQIHRERVADIIQPLVSTRRSTLDSTLNPVQLIGSATSVYASVRTRESLLDAQRG